MKNQRNLIQKSKLWVVKVGSSILTRENGAPDFAAFKRLALEISHLRKSGKKIILVSSGAIACGMHKMGLRKKPEKIAQKQAIAAAGQIALMNHYEKVFAKQGLHIAQILLTRADLNHRERSLNTRHAIHELLLWGYVPIINENDTVAVEEIKVGDNDNLSAWVTAVVGADLLVILTDQNGLYTADPRQDKKAKRIPLVEKLSPQIKKIAKDTQGRGTTGGMITKLQAAERAGEAGVATVIASGKKSGVLLNLAKGQEEGSLVLASHKKRLYAKI